MANLIEINFTFYVSHFRRHRLLDFSMGFFTALSTVNSKRQSARVRKREREMVSKATKPNHMPWLNHVLRQRDRPSHDILSQFLIVVLLSFICLVFFPHAFFSIGIRKIKLVFLCLFLFLISFVIAATGSN